MTKEELETIVREVLEEAPGEVKKFRATRKKMIGHLMGEAMRANPRLNPEMTREVIEAVVDDFML